jgi:hypothetical protein
MREYSSRGKISVELKFAPFSGQRRRGYLLVRLRCGDSFCISFSRKHTLLTA